MPDTKILIVDDDKDMLWVLEERLCAAGFDVVLADNGQLALIMAQTHHPDLIILDMQMPGMDGGEVLRRLKMDPTTESIPVLLLTCLLSTQESAKKKHSCGASLMLSKSVDATELVSAIKGLLSLHVKT